MTRLTDRRVLWIALVGALLLAGPGGCVSEHSYVTTTVSFEVTFTAVNGCGVDGAPACPHSGAPIDFTASVRALDANGNQDTTFSGTVVLSLVPSGLFPEGSPVLPDGRRVALITLSGGEATDVPLQFTRAFGEITLMVEDYGYTKAPNVADAACYELFPAAGCFAVDDDDPDFGTGAAGVSEVITFDNPRIYDIQYTPPELETVGDLGGFPSPLFGFRPTIDAAERPADATALDDVCDDGQGGRRELVVVTGLSVDGFYAHDVCNAAGASFASMYIYNFNTPEDLMVGDCLLELTGTIQEFQGFTELKNPFWVVDVDDTNPTAPRCADLLPTPVTLDASLLGNDHAMEGFEAGIVTITDATLATEFRACDLNGNGALSGSDEWDCSEACGDEIECVVLESYQTYFQWSVWKDGREVNVVTRGVIDFDPEANLGLQISRITGTLRHLDFGRPAWTIEPRDDDDFVL
ncbi:MAG: hypothetical protein ABI333_19855 [bacterium]